MRDIPLHRRHTRADHLDRFIQLLLTAAAWTYWNSEFTVVGLALLWVYLRRHEAFARFRNTLLLANVLGLLGYVVMPTAPPRIAGIKFIGDCGRPRRCATQSKDIGTISAHF